jgi:mannosyltransferase
MVSAGPIKDIDVIAPHFKRRLSGVTSTVIQLIPAQRALGVRVAVLGPGLPSKLPHIGWWRLPGLWRRPKGGGRRIWHARRNIEMAAGIILRDGLRMPLKLIFTSAGQRHHKPLTEKMMARMDAIVATSRRSGSYLKLPYEVVMHGIDIDAFHPEDAGVAQPGYLVGCTGRVRHQKGTDLFVDAMIALLPRFPEWNAVITGRVTPEHRAFAAGLQERIRQAGLEDRIRFIGEVDDIHPWYRHMTLFVAPSRNEGFGLTPLEAMASGTAVVASDAGAYAEMIRDGTTGAVVPAGDGDALREAISRYLADPALARAHGHAGVEHVRANFALEREAMTLASLYQRLAVS